MLRRLRTPSPTPWCLHQRSTSIAFARSSSPASLSSSAASTDSSAGCNGNKEEPPKYKPGWFSRNPGVTLGGILIGIGLYIYRGSRGKKNFEALQTPIAEAAVISPYEAWELRSSNAITPEIYETVRDGVTRAFPEGKATMQQFDQYLGFKLAQVGPTGLNKAYHLERVLLSLPTDENRQCDVDAQLVAFSMAVKGTVDERLRNLFNLATKVPAGEGMNEASEDKEEENKEVEQREMSPKQLEHLLHLLLETYQIPSEKRVLAVEDAKYPFQQYRVATASDLLQAAVQDQVRDKKITEEEARERQTYTFDAFSQLLRGKTICIWGECFSNSKKKMKN
ncbi:hypothetical protein PsorP6_010820 [Peronosclerospora sorghi]|uniref:Uncharacterized protein n=1 Tax=Peronosclerospora sorghi TaxID=230839 RepID=A0ACC0VWI8_9STRA|nr:hypothetical protein PsorP6_010820 [Peronosclerospora sorghi]